MQSSPTIKPGIRLTVLATSLAAMGTACYSGVASAQSADETLREVVVVGRSGSGTYQSSEVSGTKSELPLRELPQSVRVMTRQAIDDLGATRLDDVLDYVGGVSRQNSFGGLWDNFAIRGMPGDQNTGMPTLLNGFSGNRGFNAPRDMANVERIEFLKGPAAALYGTSEPGGTLNIVTKAPRWRSAHSAEAYVGSYDYYRAAVDSTGPLSQDFAYRLNAAVETRGSFRDRVEAKRQVFAPAFTWRIAPASTLQYTGEWLHHKAPLDRGVVAVGNDLGAVSRERFLGEPNDGDVSIDNRTHQLTLHHDWNDQWRSRFALSYRQTQLQGFSTEPTALLADNRTLTRQRRYRDYASDDVAGQAELLGKAQTGSIAHDLLVGVEAYEFSFDQRMLRVNPSGGSPYAIDIYHPVYGQPQPTPQPNTDTRERQRNIALYAQDAVTLAPQWRLLAGLRWDNYRQNLLSRVPTARFTSQSQSEVSPRVGISWLPTDSWTIYASAATSFRPNMGTSVSGESFDPEKGRALELGAKWEGRDKRVGATAALFDIRKRNVLTSDPANPGSSIAAGEVTSRGIEFDLAGQVTQRWRVNASFVLNDAEISRDNVLVEGSRVLNVPRINGSLLAVYENRIGSGRYGIGGGVTYVGERLGQARTQLPANQPPEFELPSYTTAKLVGYWRVSEALRLSLDVDNLFDETYYVSSFSRMWVSPGTARTVTLGLQAKF